MVIPPDLPRVSPQRTESLPNLPLRQGQTIEARVVGPGQNGATQVEIRGQVVSLNLPVAVNAGETIRLEVQGQGQQMRLAMQVAAQPNVPASPAPANPTQINMPLPQQPAMPAAAPPQAAVQAAQQAMVQAQFGNQPDVTAPQTPTATNLTGGQAATSAAPAQGAQVPQTGLPAQTAAAQPAAPMAPTQTPAAPANATPVTTATTVQVTQQVVPQTVAPLYPQASPGLPNPAAVAAAATALNQPAPASNTPRGDVAPVLAAAPVGGGSSNALASNTSGMPNPQQPATPQAALNQMMQNAVPRQAPVTDLTAALSSIAGKVVLPEPVARAAQMVMAGRMAIDGKLDGAALQQAVRGSGVFQEAALAKGQLPLPQTDMKSALLTLRQTLVNWLGNQAALTAVAQVPPPLKGITPRARAHDAPMLDVADAPEEIGRQLLERTESALARTRMHQHASMPDQAAKTADWSMDLPVLIGQHQTTMQLQIHRDEGGEGGSEGERGWQMRFAINLPSMGEVGAQVSLRAGTAGVMLWATEPETSAALDAEVNALREGLVEAGLKPGAVIVRHGEPHVPPPPESAGHFVDART
ncbi:MAG: flagellar hook-length control protein FliK [Candidatus Devosia phytovorans]|uniref:Flagellar hook-length control protein FliK n=1 Tax=Candidatus Devosia phytovorans TaxID=3121372 RepID=A0AAJ5VW87_9HYPH|nr:flagellar hook-length control protein FliK [Devosia sp.]WEK06073.1 MAG: flagellar hook-length control protein FliK [Devosia sp.]